MHFSLNRNKYFNKYASFLFALAALIVPDLFLRYVVKKPSELSLICIFIPNLYTIIWSVLILILCRIILPKKAGCIVFSVYAVFFNILVFAQYTYYQIFTRFFFLDSLALAGEASGYFRYAIGLISYKAVIVLVFGILMTALAVKFWCKPPVKLKTGFLLELLPILGLIAIEIIMNPQTTKREAYEGWDIFKDERTVYVDFTDPNHAMDITGIHQFVFRNIYKLCTAGNNYTSEDYAAIESYFDSKGIGNDNEMTGIFKGKNLILVMMESIDDWMISEEYTPTMKYMMDNGINFADHYSPIFGFGYTFNSEFTANTGFYNPESSLSATRFTKNIFPYALPNLFRSNGYRTTSFHFNDPSFYNRGIMHLNFGYDEYVSLKYMMDPFESQRDFYVAENNDVYEKMTDGDNFFDFFITYSAHVPYGYADEKLGFILQDYPEYAQKLEGLPTESYEYENLAINFLAHDTDDFFRRLLERLDADGLLENTVIAAFADHYAYGLSDKDYLEQQSIDSGSGVMEKTPFFVYAKGIEPVKVKTPSDTSDILPTLANMFGLEKNKYTLGNDVFSDTYKLVYFSGGKWYDGKIYYDPYGEYAEDNSFSEKSEKARAALDINDTMINSNYFNVLRKSAK